MYRNFCYDYTNRRQGKFADILAQQQVAAACTNTCRIGLILEIERVTPALHLAVFVLKELVRN